MKPPQRDWSKEDVERLREEAVANVARIEKMLGTERLNFEIGGLFLQRLVDLGDMIDLVLWLQHEAGSLRQHMGMNVANQFVVQAQVMELQAKISELETENEELRERVPEVH